MDENFPLVSAVEDASIFTQFINLAGDIGKTLYLAKHPEENDEAPRLMVFQKADGDKISENAGTTDGLPIAA